ncbi:hypothetical protein ACFL0T_08605 [Candidatus Omnitrophota bacterium]
MKSRSARKKGAVLILVVALGFGIISIVLIALRIPLMKFSVFASQSRRMASYYHADAGIQRAVYEIITFNPPGSPINYPFYGHTVTVTITSRGAGTNLFDITSEPSLRSGSGIRALIRRNAGTPITCDILEWDKGI